MRALIQKTIFILFIFVTTAVGVETETVATVDGEVITNVDVFKEASAVNLTDSYYNSGAMKSVLRGIIDPLVFEQYAKRENICVTEEEVFEVFLQDAHERGFATVEEYYQKKFRAKNEKDIRDSQNYKMVYKGLLDRKLVAHFSPNVSDVNEKDIQKYVEHYKKTYAYPMGHREGIRFRSISVRLDEFDSEGALRKELEKIKQRINNGESFEDVAGEYADNDDFVISNKLSKWWRSSEFKKQGVDALVSWRVLKGKAVIATLGEAGVVVLKVEDYVADNRMGIEDAVNDKAFREEVIANARGHKWSNVKRKLLRKLKAEDVKYAGEGDDIYQKLADDYEIWWVENFKDEPGFRESLKRMREDKAKYIARQKKKSKNEAHVK